jgi:hypothetical protein
LARSICFPQSRKEEETVLRREAPFNRLNSASGATGLFFAALRETIQRS